MFYIGCRLRSLGLIIIRNESHWHFRMILREIQTSSLVHLTNCGRIAPLCIEAKTGEGPTLRNRSTYQDLFGCIRCRRIGGICCLTGRYKERDQENQGNDNRLKYPFSFHGSITFLNYEPFFHSDGLLNFLARTIPRLSTTRLVSSGGICRPLP